MKKLQFLSCLMPESLISGIQNSRLAKLLLLIIFIKFLIFYGFLKGFLYPKYLKPHYESDQHRSEQVIKDLLNTEKQFIYDRKH